VDALIALIGTVVLLLTVSDIFQSVIVPRPVSFVRPSAYVARYGWRIVAQLCTGVANAERRESLLGVFAPALLVTLLVLWVVTLVFGFGAIFYALRGELHPVPANFWAAVYYAGTSTLTLGYGDITAATGLARALSLAAAALGLGTFAVVVAFLFSLFGAYQKREAFLVSLRERTGAPPSGVGFLVTHAQLRMLDALPATFREAEMWIAEIMETHLAYPILIYFRSAHDEQSWIGTLGALLDATSLMLTALDVEGTGPAKMLNLIGRHLVHDFSDYFEFEGDAYPGIERSEFHAAYEHLRAAGLPLLDEEGAWTRFAALRATYAGPLNAFAKYFRIPPAQWIGDRSILPRPRHAAAPVLTAAASGGDAPPRNA
jgi:hypothetical protein